MQQVIDPVVLGLSDSLVEAAATGCRGDDVPEPYPPLRKPLDPFVIVEDVKIFSDRLAKQPPELVRWMSIVTLRRE